MDTDVLIVGPGRPAQAQRLSKSFDLPFTVAADTDRSVYHLYGLDKVMFFIQRSGNFLIDKDGVLRYIHQVTNPQAAINQAEVMQAVQALQ